MTVTTPEHTESAPVMQPAPTQPPKKRPTALIMAACAGGLVVLIAAAVVITAAAVGGDKPAKTPARAAAAAPSTFTAMGQIKLSLGGFIFNSVTDRRCTGWRGYDDIKAGTQVVIKDSSAATVAVGSLDVGEARVDDSTQRGIDCTLKFTIRDVPAGKGFYSIEVSHRGGLQYSEKDMQGYLLLTLGS